MSDYYEDMILTGNSTGSRKEMNLPLINKYIKLGLSSVKIAKIIGVSYPTVLKNVDKYLPSMSERLRSNGRKQMIRKKNDRVG